MNRFPIQSLPALAFRLMFLAVALSIVTGCNNKTPASAEVKGPRSVVVSAVEEQKLQTSLTMPAELTPLESVAIYPKETGFLQWIGVDRGSRVHKGQLLVRITAPEVDARRAQGQAQLQAADSQLTATQAKLASDEATSNHLEDAAKTPGVVAGNDLLVAEKTVEADRANANPDNS